VTLFTVVFGGEYCRFHRASTPRVGLHNAACIAPSPVKPGFCSLLVKICDLFVSRFSMCTHGSHLVETQFIAIWTLGVGKDSVRRDLATKGPHEEHGLDID
jgi:hypothetical protein